jgi:hypothetical protein
MAKEFLQKHFIKDVKGSLYRGKGSTPPRLQNKTFTENGIFKADKGYDGFGEVGVDVPAPNIQPITVTENGTYTAPDGVDGYSPVSVEIASAGGTDERFKQLVEKTIAEVSDDTVTSVGISAFNSCSKLTSVNLPLATSVGNNAFHSCSQLTSVNLPLATSIGQGAFNSCSQLTSINLPSATSVGISAFNGCPQLTSVNLPLATSVGNNAFNGCPQLTSVNLPLVTSVSSSAFQSCSKLTSVNLPLATSVGNNAFYSCSQLTSVILRAETICALSNTNAFNKTPFASGNAGGTLLVPRSLLESYKTATNWSVIWGYGHNRFLALEDYTVDGTITGEIDWDKLNNTQGG